MLSKDIERVEAEELRQREEGVVEERSREVRGSQDISELDELGANDGSSLHGQRRAREKGDAERLELYTALWDALSML